MNAVQQISLYSTLFYVFLGIAILGLAVAVFLFFYFDIPSVYALMTGKARRETISKMEEQHAKTGNLRFQYPGHTGEITRSGNSGKISRSGKLGHGDKNHHTGKTGRTGRLNPVAQEPQPPQAPEAAPVYETEVLQTAAPETQVLGEQQTAETALLKHNAPVQPSAPAPAADNGIRFLVTENTLVIHTDEII